MVQAKFKQHFTARRLPPTGRRKPLPQSDWARRSCHGSTELSQPLWRCLRGPQRLVMRMHLDRLCFTEGIRCSQSSITGGTHTAETKRT